MATKLFGAAFPEWFGSIGASAYTLFQVMTLESWSMGIVRPVMEAHPYAWMFFIPFILVTTFTMLNLFIGIVVNAMQSEHDEVIEEEMAAKEKVVEEEKAEEQAARIAAQESRDMLADEIRQLRQEIADLRQDVRAGKSLA